MESNGKTREQNYGWTKLESNEETKEEKYGETREDIDIKRLAKNRIIYLQSEAHDQLKWFCVNRTHVSEKTLTNDWHLFAALPKVWNFWRKKFSPLKWQ